MARNDFGRGEGREGNQRASGERADQNRNLPIPHPEGEWIGTYGDAGIESQLRQRGFADRGPGAGARGAQSFAGRGPKGYARSDERIHEEVCELLTRNPYVDASDIEVRVENGEVTLTGTIHDRYMKRIAEDVAESASGVHDVHNRLTVRPADPDLALAERGEVAGNEEPRRRR